MEIEKIFKEYVKLCDIISKICGDMTIISSNGVFMWKSDGMLSLCTFNEKTEKDICPFLYGIFGFNPSLIVLLDKYLQIMDIEFNMNLITLKFSNIIPKDLSESKIFMNNIDSIYKDDNLRICVDLKYDIIKEDYKNYYNIIDTVSTTMDYDNKVTMDLDSTTISNSETVVDLLVGEFRVRIAKSLFCNIVKGDKISIECMPYLNSSNIFLVKATNSKERCLLVNFINAMKL